jgi:hypothetical protein
MLFKSPHAAMRFNVWPQRYQRHPVTGEIIDTIPGYAVEFGRLGPEVTIRNPETGELETFADITGHFYDSDLAAQEHNFTPEQKDTVEQLLLMKCRTVPMYIQLVEKVRVPFPKPWHNYDEMSPEQVVDAAQLLELVPETVAYEQENGQRASILEVLEPILGDLARKIEPQFEYAEGALDVPTKVGGIPQGGGAVLSAPQGRTDGGIMLGGIGGL